MTDPRPSFAAFLRANVPAIVTALGGFALVTAAFAIVDPVIGVVVGVGTLLAGILVHWLRTRPFDRSRTHPVGSVLGSGALGAIALLAAIQLVPYGRDHSNPPITAEPAWDSPATRELAVRACFDCHSNEVDWPWYSNVAPFSWATQRHVEEGREHLNFSEWDRPQHEPDEAAETVEDGSMPPRYYTLTHSDARLTEAEKRQLMDGLNASLGEGSDDEHGDEEHEHDDEDHDHDH